MASKQACLLFFPVGIAYSTPILVLAAEASL